MPVTESHSLEGSLLYEEDLIEPIAVEWDAPRVIVLDTHAWVWWLTKPEKLGKKAARAIKGADRVGVPAICVWEVAMKAHAGKLKFDQEPLERSQIIAELRGIEVLYRAGTVDELD